MNVMATSLCAKYEEKPEELGAIPFKGFDAGVRT